jgi:hypothetical protein
VGATCVARLRTLRHAADPPTARSAARASSTRDIGRRSLDSGNMIGFLAMEPRDPSSASYESGAFITDLVSNSP